MDKLTENEKKILSLGLSLYKGRISKIKKDAESAGMKETIKMANDIEKTIKDLEVKLL